MAFIRLFIIITALFFLQLSTQAQNIAYGLKGGLTTGTPYSKPKEGDSGKAETGPVLGVFLKYSLYKHFDILAELSYSNKSASFRTHVSGDTIYPKEILGVTYYIPTSYAGWVNGNFDNYYIDIPVMLAYKTGKRFNILAGPQVSYLLKGKNTGTADIAVGKDPNYPYTTVKDRPFDESDQLNKWDYSFVCGINYEATRRLFFNFNSSYGLRSIYKKSYTMAGGTVRNIYLQLSTAYRIDKIKDNPYNETPNTVIQ